MNILKIYKDKVDFVVSKDELGVLSNALNEVCNGIDAWEFEIRLGMSLKEAQFLLKSLNSIYQQMSGLNIEGNGEDLEVHS